MSAKTIWVATWNTEGQQISDEAMDAFMVREIQKMDDRRRPDMIVVGLQEGRRTGTRFMGSRSKRGKWVSKMLSEENRLGNDKQTDVKSKRRQVLLGRGERLLRENPYIEIGSTHFWGLTKKDQIGDRVAQQIGAVIRKNDLEHLTNVHTFQYQKGGVRNITYFSGEKGYVGIIVTFYDRILVFVSTHLASDDKKSRDLGEEIYLRNIDKKREKTVEKILQDVTKTVGKKCGNRLPDAVFILGDFNYRIRSRGATTDQVIESLWTPAGQNDLYQQDTMHIESEYNQKKGLYYLLKNKGFEIPVHNEDCWPTYKFNYENKKPLQKLYREYIAGGRHDYDRFRVLAHDTYFKSGSKNRPFAAKNRPGLGDFGWLDRVVYNVKRKKINTTSGILHLAKDRYQPRPPELEGRIMAAAGDHCPVILKIKLEGFA